MDDPFPYAVNIGSCLPFHLALGRRKILKVVIFLQPLVNELLVALIQPDVLIDELLLPGRELCRSLLLAEELGDRLPDLVRVLPL